MLRMTDAFRQPKQSRLGVEPTQHMMSKVQMRAVIKGKGQRAKGRGQRANPCQAGQNIPPCLAL